MAGITFPNVAGTLAPLIQMDRQAEESRLNRERLERHDQWMMDDRKQARELQQLQVLQGLDEKKRAKLKDAAEWTSKAVASVLSAAPEHRPSAYQMALQEGKTLGYDVSNLPPQYSPGMDGMLQFYAGKSADYLKMLQDRPQPMGLPGAPSAAPTAAPANREQFISMMTPHALQVAQATGLDPRLVLAQAALETGFGTAAPGNNYFGIKSHGQPGGQTLATNEAGPGGMVPTQASFRTYADPGASARDYGDFLKTNPRYASVLGAQGLDAQIDAMGRSGYATDPQYGAKLRAIAQSLPQIGPTMGTPPPSMVAQGANAAPMPNVSPQQVGALPGNPVAMPGVPAGIIPQGDAVTGQGDVRTPPGAAPAQNEVLTLRAYVNSRIPGAQVMGVGPGPLKKPVYDAQGRVMIRLPDGQYDAMEVPKAKDPKEQDGVPGVFGGKSIQGQSLNLLINEGVLTIRQAAELGAGKTVTLADGSVMFMTPSGLVTQPPPAPPLAPGATPTPPQPGTAPTPPAGGVQIGAPRITKEMEDYRKAKIEFERINAAAQDFLKEWNATSSGERLRSLSGANTPLNTSYNILALLSKGEALFNLGVLNGPDLALIRRTLPDPSTLLSGLNSPEDVERAVNKVVGIMQGSITARERSLGIAPPAPAGNSEAPKVRTFNPKTGKLE